MNSRRRSFCEYYVQGMTATEAARRAGYSPRSARSQGQRLLTFDDVKKTILELQNRATTARVASASEVREHLTEFLRDENQRITARIRAGEALLKHGGDGQGERMDEQGERKDEPGQGAEIVLPWRPSDIFYPTAVEGENGEIIPLENPGEGMTLVMTRQQLNDLVKRYHVNDDQAGDPLQNHDTNGGKDQ